MYQSIQEEAWDLVHSLASQCANPQGLGTMSPAPYDTAWVAMTEKRGKDGKLRPLFPEAYDYLKQTQSEDGSWAAETSDADGIVNTLAALLALKKQERELQVARAENESRCVRAEAALRRMLNGWDLSATDRVGMEVLVPTLLTLLEAEGMSFEFPARGSLMAMNQKKMARLGPVLTSPVQTTLIHTLEAFVGILDFDKVKQHQMPNGSMLASPSSTAAYLMNATEWDEKAEEYLNMVYRHHSATELSGGFPSAFPSTIFETSWVVDTLLESGFDKDEFLLADIRKLTVLLETCLKEGKGVVGWAPHCLPDADDTAKTISSLRLLGWEKEVEPMLKTFEADASFITYRGERNASTSANCNVLSCLLKSSRAAEYTKQIVKCASFLCGMWTSNEGPDKWHTSVQYPMMLIAQALVLMLKRWSQGELDVAAVPEELMYQNVPRTLLDILARTMRTQNADGSWESKREVTAYAVLTLAPLLSLPWVDFLKPEGIACMYRGKAYLEDRRNLWREAERVWVEKTVYGSPNLSQAYCLAASKIVVPTAFISAKISDMFPFQWQHMARSSASVGSLAHSPQWRLQLSALQSGSYMAILDGARGRIVESDPTANLRTHMERISFAWIGCRDHLATKIPTGTLREMMLLSLFTLQVDEYMTISAAQRNVDNVADLKNLIFALCRDQEKRRRIGDGDADSMPKKLSRPNGKALPQGQGDPVSTPTQGTKLAAPSDEASPKSLIEQTLTSGRANDVQHKRVDSVVDVESEQSSVSGATSDVEIAGTDIVTDVVKDSPDAATREAELASITAPAAHEQDSSIIPEARAKDVESVLSDFVNAVLQHPKILFSAPFMRTWLAQELQAFLLTLVSRWEGSESIDVSSTFFRRTRTTSADSTGCPHSLVFYLCLIGEDQPAVTNAQQRYALEDASRHLAAMCRQHNDIRLGNQAQKQTQSINSSLKPSMFEPSTVAEYERRCLDRVMMELEESLSPKVSEQVKLFIHATELGSRMLM